MAEIYLTDHIGQATISFVLDDATEKLIRIEVNNAESKKLKATLINTTNGTGIASREWSAGTMATYNIPSAVRPSYTNVEIDKIIKTVTFRKLSVGYMAVLI